MLRTMTHFPSKFLMISKHHLDIDLVVVSFSTCILKVHQPAAPKVRPSAALTQYHAVRASMPALKGIIAAGDFSSTSPIFHTVIMYASHCNALQARGTLSMAVKLTSLFLSIFEFLHRLFQLSAYRCCFRN